MTNRRALAAAAGLALSLALVQGCAVQRTKAPQIDPKTAYALNLETQVKQANEDYLTFFTDAGTAVHQGRLTRDDVAKFNVVGAKLKVAIEEANRLTKVYATNYDTGTAQQVGLLLAQIAADFSDLLTAKTQAEAAKAQADLAAGHASHGGVK